MLPSSVRAVLWSYDLDKVDLQNDKGTIIKQVLNFGSAEATNWLFSTYGKNEVAAVANQIPKSSWDKKSFALWSLVLRINPPRTRIIT